MVMVMNKNTPAGSSSQSPSNLHQMAVDCARRFQTSERELILILKEILKHRIHRQKGFNSLYDYAMRGLGLSESQACPMVRLIYKSAEAPKLMEAVVQGKVSLSKAARVCSVVNAGNQTEWVCKAGKLPKAKLEREIAKANPKEAVQVRFKPVAEDRIQLQCGISLSLYRKLQRLQDICSQKSRRNCNLEDTLEQLTDLALKKWDVLNQKSKHKPVASTAAQNPAQARSMLASPRVKSARSAALKRQARRRSQDHCEYPGCQQRRFLQVHHITPLSKGGRDELSNLRVLCFSHHRTVHEREYVVASPRLGGGAISLRKLELRRLLRA